MLNPSLVVTKANELLTTAKSAYKIALVNGEIFLGDVSGAIHQGEPIEPEELVDYVLDLISDEVNAQQ